MLIGADSLSPKGLVNKIGTLCLALAAKELAIDVYVLSGSEKLLPADYPLQFQELQDSAEILTEYIHNVTAVNYYFDLTPLEYIKGVVTEKGIMTPNQLKKELRGLRPHKVFKSLWNIS